MDRPDDEEIITELTERYDTDPAEIVSWLKDMDFDAALARLQGVTA